MTIGTGTVVAATVLSDTPACTSSRLRKSGWRAPVVALLKLVLPRKWLRRVVGVEPPFGPPFLRVLASVASKEWLSWVPTFGLPSLLALPGTITFRPDRSPSPFFAAVAPPRQPVRPPLLPFWPMPVEAPSLPPAPPTPSPAPHDVDSAFGSWLPGSSEVTGVYTYACQDAIHGAHAGYCYPQILPSGPALLLTRRPVPPPRMRCACRRLLLHLSLPEGVLDAARLCSIAGHRLTFVKMLLMHAYASLFMLLSQGNCREAFAQSSSAARTVCAASSSRGRLFVSYASSRVTSVPFATTSLQSRRPTTSRRKLSTRCTPHNAPALRRKGG